MHWITNLVGGPKRVNHAAARVGHLIYSFGGFDKNLDFEKLLPISIYVLNTVTLRWTEIRSDKNSYVYCPYERYGHTAVQYGTDIILWGGRNDNRACNTLYIFDTRRQRWRCPVVTGATPLPRDGHSACVINHCMYIFGGFMEDLNCFSDDVHYLDLRLMAWNTVKVKGEIRPPGRDFHSASVIGSRMYILGGRGESAHSHHDHTPSEKYWSSVYYFDTETSRWHRPSAYGDIPIGRRSLSTFVYHGCIYMFGGCNGDLNQHFNDLHMFNPKTNEWKEVKPLGKRPSARRRQGCVRVDDRVYIFCGSRPKENPAGPVLNSLDEHLTLSNTDLEDLGDMYVLQLGVPSLTTLCCMKVIQERLNTESLPARLQQEILAMSTPNKFPL